MNRFHSAKIYRLVCETGKEYIGSTINTLNQRLREHKCITNKSSSKYLINPRIELIKDFPCENRRELEMEETKYIKASTNCVNIALPYRLQQQYYLDNKEKKREYDKQYRIDNKEKKRETNKRYRLENKEIIKEKRNEKFNCECGGRYSRSCKSQHIKSKKHQTYLKGLSSEPLS